MDTRSKILPSAAGLSVGTLVIGYFDPVTADHASRLAELGEGLTVAIADPPDPLLPARARAELVAALRCVKHVVMGDPRQGVEGQNGLGDARPAIDARRVIDETAAHAGARAALVRRIVTA